MLAWGLWERAFVSWKSFPEGPWQSICATGSKVRQITPLKMKSVLFITWTIELHFNNTRLFSGNRGVRQRQNLFILSPFCDQYVEALFHCMSQLSMPLQSQGLTNLYAGCGRFLGLHYWTASTVSSQITPPESKVSFSPWKQCRQNSQALPLTLLHHLARERL